MHPNTLHCTVYMYNKSLDEGPSCILHLLFSLMKRNVITIWSQDIVQITCSKLASTQFLLPLLSAFSELYVSLARPQIKRVLLVAQPPLAWSLAMYERTCWHEQLGRPRGTVSRGKICTAPFNLNSSSRFYRELVRFLSYAQSV